ncbi:hypothetical protein ATE47_03455 [Chryseobacterium sp. IHB B 17019]|uniref:hypothetical protein n=1 Tax=Chryseobacterium sp. IHB B 17019 TaxID=1721091 RepID=UPI00071F2388|nr:hypothetical protein [Chryseobacterium sp. IHB B 17019]ALR29640.1 hypothetical protein ATE47_03455 [Chryseobacterium sp. IHB B 17019]
MPKDTTEIVINGFCLPLEVLRAVTTARAYDENGALMLVYYEGFDQNGDNHAKNPKFKRIKKRTFLKFGHNFGRKNKKEKM